VGKRIFDKERVMATSDLERPLDDWAMAWTSNNPEDVVREQREAVSARTRLLGREVATLFGRGVEQAEPIRTNGGAGGVGSDDVTRSSKYA
jgi:hypothetical protein